MARVSRRVGSLVDLVLGGRQVCVVERPPVDAGNEDLIRGRLHVLEVIREVLDALERATASGLRRIGPWDIGALRRIGACIGGARRAIGELVSEGVLRWVKRA